jgi:soluble lytic murein transglycosylase
LRQLQRYADSALKVQTCPRNFSLLLAYKLEAYLQTNDVWNLFDRLQKHGTECVKPDDPWAEFVLLRAGLFFMARTLPDEALPLLERATQANDKREEYRALYWLYYAYKNADRMPEARKTRETLYAKYPISWHAILGLVEDGTDPLKAIMKRPIYKDAYDSGDTLADSRVSWLHLLMLQDDAYAAKRYGEFVVRSLPIDAKPGLLQYLARAFDRAALYRLQIITMNQLNLKRPELLTHESLRLLYPKPFFEEIDNRSPHLDTALILGLARQESSFDPSATSRANARGLFQILPSTARGIKKLKKNELYDYAQNIEVGSRYVLRLVDFFGGSVEKALASYNAGQGTIRKWEGRYDFAPDIQLFLDMMPYRETREYVPSILRNAYWYHRLFPEFTAALSDNIMTSELLRVQLFPDLKKFNNPTPASDQKP